MTAIDDRTALLIIDVQTGLDDPRLGARNNPAAEGNMARLLARWRAADRRSRVGASGSHAQPLPLQGRDIESLGIDCAR